VPRRRVRTVVIGALLLGSAASLAPVVAGDRASLRAQAPLAATAGRWVEAGAFHHAVSNDYGDWTGAYARAVIPVGSRDIFYGEAVTQRAFNDRGTFVGLANRHEWGAGFFTLAAGGHGMDARFFPEWRADVTAGQRFGARQRVVATAGASYIRSRDVYRDYAATGSLAVYLTGIVFEAGARYNASTPGDVQALRGYSAITAVPSPRRSVALRIGGGEEGYQLLGNAGLLQRFTSTEASVAWRERVTGGWGVLLQADAYRNPFYTRAGGTLGVARYF